MWVSRGLISGRGLTTKLESCHETPAQILFRETHAYFSDSRVNFRRLYGVKFAKTAANICSIKRSIM